ncbi:ATP-binding domain-containing protein [Sandaracinus amylolyticus]|uniref:ATP-binding domain-containing protein n=1 Tax=Sandaracinus amylolyticus TaxID=927083 RepID=UPI001F1FC11B|nr:ATP-binding domain-containing protein [Sandaracinus amylolyticus]UJR80191.1 DNA helicase [Sandaracinus amylolyticus]
MRSTDLIEPGPVDRSEPDSDEEKTRIVAEEERVLARVHKHLAARKMRVSTDGIDYDAELLSLRDQINEARLEDVPPLIEEMERLSEVAARRAKVVEGAVDPDSPYFGRLVLEEGDRRREVLIGRSTYLDPRTGVRIVDWRDAPVSRVYYRYEEGDAYEENFGGRDVHGEVVTRRSLAISSTVLRRIGSPQGVFVRAMDGSWRRAGESASRLKGGQGAAMRPEGHHSPADGTGASRGKLGMGLEGREDRFLPEITALIDPRQFELITKSDAGLVVIQGGAGSGKTTIGLHRLAYLAFQDPKRFRPDRMLVIVYNDALVRYISKVLPSLGLPQAGATGTPVTTYERWAAKQRIGHLRGLPEEYTEDTPGAVTRLKKHPVMLRMIDDIVARASARFEVWLEQALEKVEGKDEVLAFFRDQERAPLAVRLMRLSRWVAPEEMNEEDAALEAAAEASGEPSKRPAPKSVAIRHAVERTVQRARRELLDVSAAWAEMLTDASALSAAFAKHAPGEIEPDDLRTAVNWCIERCGTVMGELEVRRDEGDRAKEKRESKAPADDVQRAIDEEVPQPKLVARKRGGGDDDEDDDGDDGEDDRTVGIDGAIETEPPKLDREDDALLLRLVQRLRGPLVKGRERLRYEHILIDEAQDLSPVELAVVMGTSTKQRSVTMAGDVAQRLHMDNGFKGWPELLDAIRPRRAGEPAAVEPLTVEPLKVQYRSTHQIIEFAQDVLGPLADPQGGHAIRSGAPVELFRFAHNGEAVAFLGEALRELMQSEPRASVALIARYPEQADLYHRGLVNAEVPHLRRIAEQDFPFKPGIDVTDVRQVKGLEFDYVVLLEVSRASYGNSDEARHLLHIAATRAAHQLWVTCSGEPSPLLPQSLRDRAY